MNQDFSKSIRQMVQDVLAATPVVDMHTHLFPPSFDRLFLAGIDELLTFHYLVAEALRLYPQKIHDFWQSPQTKQADWIWQTLFVDRTPMSEACRGVLTTLRCLGLDPYAKDLIEFRDFFRETSPEQKTDRILRQAKIDSLVMTNDPFDAVESSYWQDEVPVAPHFKAALRLDRLINEWPLAWEQLEAMGYDVELSMGEKTIAEVRRFLAVWNERLDPMYLAISLPPEFQYPEASARGRLLNEAVLPFCREYHRPLALMIGVKRSINPALRLAGDGLGTADVGSIERLCAAHPENRFLVTVLARENQHQLAVAARKFGNLMIFGCWWFLNIPDLIREITAMRLDLLGLDFIPQHSDARVLEQLVYKWEHSRQAIGSVLAEHYEKLTETGWPVTEDTVRQDVTRLFVGNFAEFVKWGRS